MCAACQGVKILSTVNCSTAGLDSSRTVGRLILVRAAFLSVATIAYNCAQLDKLTKQLYPTLLARTSSPCGHV